MRSDCAPDSAALRRIAPPRPLARAIAAARAAVAHLDVVDVANALARRAKRREKSQFVIDDRDLIRMRARRFDELLRLRDIQCRRLLADDMLSRRERRLRDLE